MINIFLYLAVVSVLALHYFRIGYKDCKIKEVVKSKIDPLRIAYMKSDTNRYPNKSKKKRLFHTFALPPLITPQLPRYLEYLIQGSRV
jgi:hypothetical protein